MWPSMTRVRAPEAQDCDVMHGGASQRHKDWGRRDVLLMLSPTRAVGHASWPYGIQVFPNPKTPICPRSCGCENGKDEYRSGSMQQWTLCA